MSTLRFVAAPLLAITLGCQAAPPPAVSPAAAIAAPVVATPVAVPGPVPGTRMTEAYARLVARDLYFWGWPMANIYNRRLAFKDLPSAGLMGGIVPVAPLNHVSMLSDYIHPEERLVACPNQDVVYGAGSLGLDVNPVVLQVPDFGDRFWVYQVVDLRSDSFAELGKMYGTKPGFYLLVGPDWKGETPKGIAQVFHASTNTGFVIPRVFQTDTSDDKAAVQPLINQIDMYPLSEFDGRMKTRDWREQAKFPAQTASAGGGETKWVDPEKFFDELPLLLKDASALPGEAARYAQALALVSVGAAGSEAEGGDYRRGEKGGNRSRRAAAAVPQLWPASSVQLDDAEERRGVRHRLLHAHRRGEVQHLRQQAERDEIFLPGSRREGRPAEWRQTLYGDVRERGAPAGPGFLVADAVRQGALLCPERAESLLAGNQEQGIERERRRLSHDLRAGNGARRRQAR